MEKILAKCGSVMFWKVLEPPLGHILCACANSEKSVLLVTQIFSCLSMTLSILVLGPAMFVANIPSVYHVVPVPVTFRSMENRNQSLRQTPQKSEH